MSDRRAVAPFPAGASHVAAWLGYCAAFLLLTWPLATRPGDAVISHWDADVEQSLWVQWWFATAVESPRLALFHTDRIDYPQDVDLQLADLNLAVNALCFALGSVLGPIGAYNAALLLSFLAGALLMRRLAARLGADPGAAWLAGLLFVGSPYWLACAANGWCYLVHTWVLPLVFLALLRARDAPGLVSGALVGLALALAFHVTPYYFLYACVLLAVMLPWQWRACRSWLRRPGAGRGALLGALLLGIAVAPRAVPMALAASTKLVSHHGPLNTVLGAPLVEWLWPCASAVEARRPRVGYLVVFLGWTLLATLLAAAAARVLRRSQAMWLSSAAAMLLLSLGPMLKLRDGPPTEIPLPGAWLQRLPVFDLTTNHWRWVMPAGFCLVAAFGPAQTALARRLARRHARAASWLPVGLVVALSLEVAFVWPLPRVKPLWAVRPSPIAALLRTRDDVHAVLDRTPLRKLNQTVHGKPIALGWLPRIDARVQRANEALVASCRGRSPECLLRFGIDTVVRDDHTALLLRRRGGTRVLRAP